MRLFLLWYQILGSNATDDEHTIFKNLIRDWNQTLNATRPSGENGSTDEQPSGTLSELFRTLPGLLTHRSRRPSLPDLWSLLDPRCVPMGRYHSNVAEEHIRSRSQCRSLALVHVVHHVGYMQTHPLGFGSGILANREARGLLSVSLRNVQTSLLTNPFPHLHRTEYLRFLVTR